MEKLFPVALLLGGIVMIMAALLGFYSQEIPFPASRVSPHIRHYSLASEPALYWFFEVFCLTGGVISAAFGAKQLRSEP